MTCANNISRRHKRAVSFYPMSNQMNMLFNAPLRHFISNSNDISLTQPAVNVIDKNDRFILQLAVPGYSKENISIQVEKNLLTVTGNHNEDKKNNKYSRREFQYNRFSKTFVLDESIDQENINAEVNNGILEIALYKKVVTAPDLKKIEIN